MLNTRTDGHAENADIMKRNNLLIFASGVSTILFLFIILNMFLKIMSDDLPFVILKIIIIQSFFFFNGLLFSNVKMTDIIPPLKLLTLIRVVGTYILTMIIIMTFFVILILIGVKPDTYSVINRIKSLGPIIAVFALITAPVAEEIFFRGALLPKIGLLPTSFLFSLSHIMYGSLYEMVAAFILGLSLGIVYKRWGINHSILLHTIVNTVSLIVIFFNY